MVEVDEVSDAIKKLGKKYPNWLFFAGPKDMSLEEFFGVTKMKRKRVNDER